jgi:thiol-disulfide isomerase/thioredoxin
MQRYTRKQNHKKTQKNRSENGIVTIGLIYANWCGHCQSLKPEWQKMKNNVMKTPSYKKGLYKFSEIEDSDELKDSKIAAINSKIKGGKLTANGYPTIFKVDGGKIQYFQGGRTSNELQSWFIKTKKNNTTSFFGGKKRIIYKRHSRRRNFIDDIKSAPIWRDNSNL